MHIRTLREDEAPLLQELYMTMTREIPTAFAGTLAELEQYGDEHWQNLAQLVGTSPNMDGFVVEHEEAICGYAMAAIQTERRCSEL